MTESELDALAALAKGATPGPWGVRSFPLAPLGGELPGTGREEYHISTSWEWPGEKVVSRAYRGWTTRPNGVHLSGEDAAYIAAMHPQTTLGLIAEVKRLRALVEAAYVNGVVDCCGETRFGGPEALANVWARSDVKHQLDHP